MKPCRCPHNIRDELRFQCFGFHRGSDTRCGELEMNCLTAILAWLPFPAAILASLAFALHLRLMIFCLVSGAAFWP